MLHSLVLEVLVPCGLHASTYLRYTRSTCALLLSGPCEVLASKPAQQSNRSGGCAQLASCTACSAELCPAGHGVARDAAKSAEARANCALLFGPRLAVPLPTFALSASACSALTCSRRGSPRDGAVPFNAMRRPSVTRTVQSMQCGLHGARHGHAGAGGRCADAQERAPSCHGRPHARTRA
jgi:hypothetical protein